MNGIKTAILLGALSGVLLLGGELWGGTTGLEWALAISIVMNFFSYFFSERLTLLMYGAQPLTPQDNSSVYARVFPLVHNLTQKMSIPMPRLSVPGLPGQRRGHSGWVHDLAVLGAPH